MIKLFRKIRQKLLSENKLAGYLTYAAGEIILVVIGILIALQINNWNEEQKVRRSEKEILQNLKVELKANLNDLQISNSRHKDELKSGVFLLNLFGSDISDLSTSRLDSLFSHATAGFSFEAKDGYIKSLISSNKIDHVRNSELKASISSFDAMVFDANQEDGYVQRLINERLWPVTDGKISGLSLAKSFGDSYPEFPKGTYKSDYTWFFSNREMEDVFANIFVWKKENILDEEILVKNIERMIQIIDEELKRL